MQDLLQRLQELREIVASSPVVLNKLDEMLRGVNTPAEAMMILANVRFSITRPAPRSNNNRRSQEFNFTNLRTVSNGRTFV